MFEQIWEMVSVKKREETGEEIEKDGERWMGLGLGQ